MKIGIAKKLTGIFIIGASLYAFSIGMSYLTIRTLIDSMTGIQLLSERVEQVGTLQLKIDRLLMPPNDYLITGDPKELVIYSNEIPEIARLLSELKNASSSPEFHKNLKRVTDDIEKVKEMADELLHTKNPIGNRDAAALMEKMDAFSEQPIAVAGRMHKIIEEEMEDMQASASARFRAFTKSLFVIVVVSALFIIILYFYVSGNITKPILTLHEGVTTIGRGVLGRRLNIRTDDEIGSLSEGFNKMAASLEETKKELDRRLLELYALYNISKVLNTSFETEQLLVNLVKDISKNLDIHRVVVMLLDERKQELYAASFTDFEKEGLKEVRRRVGEGFYGLIARTGEGRLIIDVDADLDLPKEDILSPDIRSIIAVPFGRRDKVLGLLCAFKDRPGMFEYHDLELFRAVAEHVAVALENAKLYQETKMQAVTDGLTGLYNHRFFTTHYAVEVERSARYGRGLSLIMFDIDHFKHYNDAHGHPAGDELLSTLAEILRKNVRESDIPCRYGGEEFVVILPETGKEAAMALAERIRKTIADYPFPHREAQPLGALTISTGVSALPADGMAADELISKADDALYRAKEEGRNRVVAA